MTEQEILNEEEYLKRFNQGYLIAQHMPSLSKDLAFSKNEKDLPVGNAFQAEIKQYALENEKSNTPFWLKTDRLAFKTEDKQSRDIDKEKE